MVLRALGLCEGDLELCRLAQQALLHIGCSGLRFGERGLEVLDLGAQRVAFARMPLLLLDG